MADDIIHQLATACVCGPLDADSACLQCCARIEIERLRAERDDWQSEYLTAFLQLGFAVDEIANLRAAGDALADSAETALTGYSLDIYQTLPAWREARRG